MLTGPAGAPADQEECATLTLLTSAEPWLQEAQPDTAVWLLAGCPLHCQSSGCQQADMVNTEPVGQHHKALVPTRWE